jgi:hypothetical protein
MTMTPNSTVAPTAYNPETIPVEEAKRLSAPEIKIEIAEEKDAHKIVASQPTSTQRPSLTHL